MRENKTHSRILERYNRFKLGWLRDSLHFIILALAIFLLFRFGIGLAFVGGDSMLPSLQDGEIVLYTRLIRSCRPGDIISLRVPSGDYYVKRVAAAGGDTVDIRDGRIYVNDKELPDAWAQGETRKEGGAVIYPYTVRDGNVFVLGDNREHSLDSRYFGEVSRRQVRGRVLFRFGIHGFGRVKADRQGG